MCYIFYVATLFDCNQMLICFVLSCEFVVVMTSVIT